jgi:hypothetical protein
MTPPPASDRDRYHVEGDSLWTEIRVYLRYVFALARPGSRVPVFGRPRQAARNVASKTDEEQRLLLEEARVQLAGQANAMQNNQTRAATLLTLTVAELVYLVKVASNVLDRRGPALVTLWGLALAFAFLALAGAVAVLTTRAEYGGVNIAQVIDSDGDVRVELASRYAGAIDTGARTNAARLTVLRDAAWLAVMAGLLLVATIPVSSNKSDNETCEVPKGFACVRTSSQPKTTMSPTATHLPVPASTASVSTSPTPGGTLSSRPMPAITPGTSSAAPTRHP